MIASSVAVRVTRPVTALQQAVAAEVVDSLLILDSVGQVAEGMALVGIAIDTSMIGMMEGAMGISIVMIAEKKYPSNGGCFVGDRYGGADRYPQNGHGKDAAYIEMVDEEAGVTDMEVEGAQHVTREGKSYRPGQVWSL